MYKRRVLTAQQTLFETYLILAIIRFGHAIIRNERKKVENFYKLLIETLSDK